MKKTKITDLTHDVVLLNMFGVAWDGKQVYPHALETLKEMKEAGKKLVVVSNATMLEEAWRSRDKYAELSALVDEVYTSGQLLHEQINNGLIEKTFGEDAQYYTIGAKHKTMFANCSATETDDMSQADFIYIGVVDTLDGVTQVDETAYLPEIEQALELGLTMIYANPEMFTIGPNGRQVTQGAIAAAYTQMGGTVMSFTKFDAFAAIEDKYPGLTQVMVGDSLPTDIKEANKAGIDSVLVTETGSTSLLIKETEKSLEQLCLEADTTPTYTIDVV